MQAAITLRPATLQDAELLLSWRNDEQTRRASHDSSEIPLAAHLVWLSGLLSNPQRRLFIAEREGVPVGSARADRGESEETVLSWTVAPAARGQGVGKAMLAALLEEIRGPVRAEVKTGNVASARIAESAGLALVREENGVLHYAGPART